MNVIKKKKKNFKKKKKKKQNKNKNIYKYQISRIINIKKSFTIHV